MNIIIIFLILISIILILNKQYEGFSSNTNGYARNKTCNYQMISVLKHFIKANELNQNTNDNWSVYLPCGYNQPEKELDNIKPTSIDQKIFIIRGCDNLSRKDNLWDSLQKKYGTNNASKLMPRTYLLNNVNDIKDLKKEYSPGKVYIMKKNIQRQTGLLVTKKIDEMINGYNSGYVIAQEMLQDPYLIDNRKTNCRIYLLVVCKNDKKKAYIFDDGFMYYTKKNFKPHSTNLDRIITSGYVDRKVYEKNPLTLKDFDTYLTSKGHPTGLIYQKAKKLLNKTMKAASPKVCNKSNVSQQVSFQLFGCDLAYNKDLEVSLIEMNKGPNLAPHGPRDSKLKHDLIDETFKLVGVVPNNDKNSHFIRVY